MIYSVNDFKSGDLVQGVTESKTRIGRTPLPDHPDAVFRVLAIVNNNMLRVKLLHPQIEFDGNAWFATRFRPAVISDTERALLELIGE